MKRSYKDIDLDIILFTVQDVITFSTGLKGSEQEDSDAMDDVYDNWLNGLNK